MNGFAQARRMMVDGQVRPSDVTDGRVIDAFLAVPREQFVDADRRDLAYLDLDLAVGKEGEERHLLKPMTLSKLIHAAAVQPTDAVLDVACATGYSTAILSHLAAHVVALERFPALAEAAGHNLAELGMTNVTVRAGPLPEGCPDDSPFDVILINGAVDAVPGELASQLRAGGRLVCVKRAGPVGKAMLYLSDGQDISGRPVFDCSAPLLPSFAKAAAFTF
jgi:protein-L-isoaspartate(D-aspartate) O-methyltransferase